MNGWHSRRSTIRLPGWPTGCCSRIECSRPRGPRGGAAKRSAVIWIDLDKYKQINDTLGHRVGDEVLCEVSRRLVSTLRQSDSVARVGGDEFTALVQDVMQPEDAELVAAKILSALIQPFQVSSQEIPISASLGISIFPEHGEDPITLLRHAEVVNVQPRAPYRRRCFPDVPLGPQRLHGAPDDYRARAQDRAGP